MSRSNPTDTALVSPAVTRRIEDALAGLRFGAVEITVHDGRIVQIERREKYRFENTVSNTSVERS